MDESKTVTSGLDLYVSQLNDVEDMKSQIQYFSSSDPNCAKKAIQNITVLRVYHQIKRIIKFTEMMDKIEDKMYESIDMNINNMDSYDPRTWNQLLFLQGQLQKTMIESHKLLEPYLDFQQLSIIEEKPAEADPANSFASLILDQESREKVRTSAQQVLAALQATEVEDAQTTPVESEGTDE